ncbi:hypothetical protein G6733_01710 [Polynucleobacter paneuropaeus]|jgi:hypothetical protein|nr:hypothetical protein G6733_01710 [Polynucleobacter paneuropaeus]QWC97169.1 hypothetical protein G6729_01620 [Polynucleobacter paneuropaeus]QWD46241.1 hypothetical protein G6659_01630 [Polynucleobacter paneuropaeus]
MHLPQITLCCIDNQYPDLGFDALLYSTQVCSFGEVIFFTHSGFVPPKHHIPNLKIISIDDIYDLETYSEFMIKGLNQYIQTSHALIVQWDGFITHPHLWQERFMDCDYIGAPWPTSNGFLVGNGGFSLRSKRLLGALQDPAIRAKHPEDQCICLENRTYLENTHGITFASRALAEQFAFELQKPAFDCFGFHAVCNLPLVLSTPNLLKLIERLPPKLIFTEQFSQFIATCQDLNSPKVMDALKKQILTLTKSMNKNLVSSRLYRHIIKSCIRRKLHQLAFDALLTRVKVTGWNTDALFLLVRIYGHQLLHRF